MNKILSKALLYLVSDASTEEQEQFSNSVRQIHQAMVKAHLATYAEGDEVLIFVNMGANSDRNVHTNPIKGSVNRVCFNQSRVFVNPDPDDKRVDSNQTWGLQYFDLQHQEV